MYNDIFDLTGKTAVVFGGGGGIGGAIARGYADFGAKVAVVDYHLQAAETVAAPLREHGGQALALQADVTDLTSIRNAYDHIIERFDQVDILVHSVGATARKPMMELTMDEWNRVMQVNLTSAFMMSRVFGEHMLERGSGKVIYVASTGGLRSSANFTAYNASKAGLLHFMRSQALEWAPRGVRVNAIAPTATETPFTADYYAANPDKKQQVIRNHPFGRLGVPGDYVGAAIYLASAASDFVTGETVVVDSGKTL